MSGIGREMTVRVLGLYLPVILALGLSLTVRPAGKRRGAALLLAVLWNIVALLALQIANQHAIWWTFATQGPALLGLPVELYLGWCCLWGAVAPLALGAMGLGGVLAVMVSFDLLAMPLCAPVLVLGRHWLAGEALAVILGLLPGLLLARWTLTGARLRLRAAMQVMIAAGLFLFVLPQVAFAALRRPLGIALHGQRLGFAAQAVIVLALPALSAVQEFVERGGGTPIPYDPPERLVVSGIYRYVANPMQVGMAAVLAAWAAVLGSGWMLAAAAMTWCYGIGLARWDESCELKARFGEDWVSYRRGVADWRMRWYPHVGERPARLYLASRCAPCSQLQAWFAARKPRGLSLVNAEEYPAHFPGEQLRRLRYVPGEPGAPSEDGVRAFARALEHLHLGWALAGAAIRLPGVRSCLQLLFDAVGFGERLTGPHTAG